MIGSTEARNSPMKILSANGAHIPAIGFGTWTLKDEQARDMVTNAIGAGYRHVDTVKSMSLSVSIYNENERCESFVNVLLSSGSRRMRARGAGDGVRRR